MSTGSVPSRPMCSAASSASCRPTKAVRTSVLATSWTDLWKSVPALHVTDRGSIASSRKLVDCLFDQRPTLTLDTCVLSVTEGSKGYYESEDEASFNRWLRKAITRKVQHLSFTVLMEGSGIHELPIDDIPLSSPFFTRLELVYIRLDPMFADFSSCPSLRDLTLIECNIAVHKLYSPSAETLTMRQCGFWDMETRTSISFPSLKSFTFEVYWGNYPVFEEMPELVTASFRQFSDSCEDDTPGLCNYPICFRCYGGTRDGSMDFDCVLLHVLAPATELELFADHDDHFVVPHRHPVSFILAKPGYLSLQIREIMYQI